MFPDQDHTAHIQVHLSLLTDPKILEMLKASASAAKIGADGGAYGRASGLQYRRNPADHGRPASAAWEQQPPEVEGMLSRASDASVRLRELHEAQAKRSRPNRS